MKKNKSIIILLIIIIGITIGIFYYFYIQNVNKNKEQNNYETNRTSTNEQNTNIKNNTNNENNNLEQNQDDIQKNNTPAEGTPPLPSTPTETNIATFSTKIYTKDSARQNNINITCSSLNDTIVKNGETFSFCNTVGQATTAKGYQKADIFDKNGNKKKGLRWWQLPSK